MLKLALAATALLLLAGCNPPPRLPGSVVKVEMEEGGHGSGVHIGNGYILTAGHVAKDKDKVTIKTDDGKEAPADVIWSAKGYDVALLHTDAKMKASRLACQAFPVGTDVRAIGNPLDQDFVSTWGRIGGHRAPDETWKVAITVDMTIVPGMSGGGLFDKEGDLIGILVGTMIWGTHFSSGIVPVGYVVPAHAFCGMLGR